MLPTAGNYPGKKLCGKHLQLRGKSTRSSTSKYHWGRIVEADSVGIVDELENKVIRFFRSDLIRIAEADIVRFFRSDLVHIIKGSVGIVVEHEDVKYRSHCREADLVGSC